MKPASVSISSMFVGATCLAGGAFLAWHHPLSPALAVAGCLVVTLLCTSVAHVWLLLIPALLPVVDLAPWTGWIGFEEFDILVLAAAAGAHLRRGWRSGDTVGSPLSLLLVLPGGVLALSTVVSLLRGLSDAGGWSFGWFQGYESPMNSLRLAKPLLLASLFVPFMKPAVMRPGAPGIPLLAWGMAVGLVLASLAALWERVAFPGMLNFSADYRTTALFWEMHVGGAALDGFLVLTVPFAIWLLFSSHRPSQLVPAGLILALASYASLTTFSRGVYAALLLAVPLLGWLLLRQRAVAGMGVTGSGKVAMMLGRLLWTVIAVVAAYWVFRSGGYRALGAALGVFAVAVATGPLAREAASSQRRAALVLGLLVGAGSVGLALLVEKGAYLAYGVLLAAVVALAILARRGRRSAVLLLSLSVALAVAAAQVAGHWGGTAALADATAVLLLLAGLSLWHVLAKRPVWPASLRARSGLVIGVGALSAVVAVFGGGQYMGNRFSAADHDLRDRMRHWGEGLALLDGPADWIVGKGLGRFPATFFFGAPGNEYPGGYQIVDHGGNRVLSLSGPRYQIGYGEVLRVSQRVPLVPGTYQLEFDLRTPKDIDLNVGICEKHLLYHEACARKTLRVKGDDAATWRHQVVQLDARHMDGGRWYAPQFVVFSIALESLGTLIDVDNLKLVDARSASVLANGDFSGEMARWFITSDHHHLPWHMKSLFLHVLFEQGVMGLVAITLLVVAALARLMAGRNRPHPLAPAMAAAIVGFLVVGVFDSLLDVPRVAFLFFLLLLMAVQASRRYV